jgi:hypothetical protein
MSRRFHSAGVSFALLIIFSALSLAQTSPSTGAIEGTVTDPQEGGVAGASVKLINPSLSLERDAITRQDGTYSFPLLQPRDGYEVRVEKDGFKQLLLPDLTVRVTEITVANGRLAVGTVSQQVSVTGDAVAVETTAPTLGGVVTSLVLTSLPLPTRDVFDLTVTDAGVVAPITSPNSTILQGSGAVYVAGARATSNNLLVNGVDSNSVEFHSLAGGAVPIPDPDAVQEFKTQTSLYDATSGFSGGGTLNLITRSGTNAWHGLGYDFVRNTVFNANDFFLNQSGTPRPIMQQNQFGGSLGGPVKGLHDTFFFVNFEGMRQKNGVTGTVNGQQPVLPESRTAASLASAFGLPASAIDPVALKLLNEPGQYGGYLVPSGSGAPLGTLGTYRFSEPVILDSEQVSARGDRDFKIGSLSDHVSLAAFYSTGTFTAPGGGSGTSANQAYYYPLGNKNIALNETLIINPTLINELVFGVNYNQRDIEPLGQGVSLADIGMTRSNESVYPGIPSFSLLNSLSFGGYGANVDRTQRTDNFNFRDTLTKVIGKQTLRVGFESRREHYTQTSVPSSPFGTVTFNGGIANAVYGPSPLGTAGNLAFRDFLIGAPTSSSTISGIKSYHMLNNDYIGFIQDDYHVLRRLTLNLGLRYDHLGQPYEQNNEYVNFDPSLLSPSALLDGGPALQAGFVVAGQNGVSPSTMIIANNGSFSPRVGFAYDVFGNGKLAIRSGYGLYYQAADDMQNSLIMNPPNQIFGSFTNSTNQTGLLANPFPNLPLPSQFPTWPTFPAITGLKTNGSPIYSANQLNIYAKDRYSKSPYTENWNFTVDGEIARGWTLEVGYLGSDGLRQTASLYLNNALLVNAANPGRFGLTTNSYANRDARVPYAGIGVNGLLYQENEARSWYDALLVTLNHPLAKNLLLKVAYTWSKSIDNFLASAGSSNGGSGQIGNQYSLEANKGLSEQDIPNRLVVTAIWSTPWFKNGRASYLLGRWNVSGIGTFQNGLATPITQNIGSDSLSGSTGYGVVMPGCQLVASGSVQNHLNNFLNSSCVSTQPLLTAGQTFGPFSPFETAGGNYYTISPGGSGYLLGSSTRGAFLAPFQAREDIAISKNFPISKLGEAGNLEFRAEAFKILNNTIYAAPAAAAGASNFGRITTTIDDTGRQLQFALKLAF